jgi:ketosteroid isomerase-like protein
MPPDPPRREPTMSADDNVKTIQAIYEAFGRGDAQAILDQVTDDVDWATETTASGAPWWGVRHGKEQVGKFFSDFGSTMEVDEFVPESFTANDDEVHTVVRFTATSRATGKKASMHLHHFFRFRGSLVAYYRGTEDTATTLAALSD